MTLPARILATLDATRVPYDVEELHHALRGETVTLHLIRDTLRLMAERGDVEETKDGWIRKAKPVVKQKGLFE